MPYNFTATDDYIKAQRNVIILRQLAEEQILKGNESKRNLFLKLSVVLLVTRFQVYIESILNEFDYKLKQTNKLNKDIPLHYRLNSLRLESQKNKIYKSLENPSNYDTNKLNEIASYVILLNSWCDENQNVHASLKFETKFPLGSTGLGELKKLLKQVDGKDMFARVKFDIEKLNEILSRRHDIIHQDKNQQITEHTIKEYKSFLEKVVKHIDKYLNRIIN
jgi:hypothetical protein